MFTENVINTLCPHGIKCVKWGCGRQHPDGRYVGFDCQHDGKCNQSGCQLHHSNPGILHTDDFKNTLEHKAIIAAIMGFFIPNLSANMQVCRFHLNGNCNFGKNCFRRHIEPIKKLVSDPIVAPKEIVKRIRKPVTCSICQQTGHNSRGCWTKKIKIDELPAPSQFL